MTHIRDREHMEGVMDALSHHMTELTYVGAAAAGHFAVQVDNAVEKSCCRGPLQQLYTNQSLSHGPISIQHLYSAVERCRVL